MRETQWALTAANSTVFQNNTNRIVHLCCQVNMSMRLSVIRCNEMMLSLLLETRVHVCDKSSVKAFNAHSGKRDRSSDSQTARRVLTGLRNCWFSRQSKRLKSLWWPQPIKCQFSQSHLWEMTFPWQPVGKDFPHRFVGKTFPWTSVGIPTKVCVNTFQHRSVGKTFPHMSVG
jgi:hypothetical protein